MSGPRSRRAWSAPESDGPLSSKERILTFCSPGYANEQEYVTIRVSWTPSFPRSGTWKVDPFNPGGISLASDRETVRDGTR
jgi:hypothetical protein